MYNQEIKERFLSSDLGKSFQTSKNKTFFGKLSEAEEKLSKDVAEMDRPEAMNVSHSLDIEELSTVYIVGSLLKRYVKWCISEGIFDNMPGGFLFFNADWVDPSGIIKENYFFREEDLIEALRVVSGFNQGYPEPVILVMAWLGLFREEIYKLTDSNVDLDNRTITTGEAFQVNGFSDDVADVLATYSQTDSAERENGTTIRTVYKDRSLDLFLKKFNPKGSAKMGIGYTPHQLNSALSRANAKYTDRGNPPRLTFENVWKSGRLNALFMLEQSGVDVFAKENEDIVCKVFRNSKRYSGILWQYRAYKKAFDL